METATGYTLIVAGVLMMSFFVGKIAVFLINTFNKSKFNKQSDVVINDDSPVKVKEDAVADGRLPRRYEKSELDMERKVDKFLDLCALQVARSAMGYMAGQVMAKVMPPPMPETSPADLKMATDIKYKITIHGQLEVTFGTDGYMAISKIDQTNKVCTPLYIGVPGDCNVLRLVRMIAIAHDTPGTSWSGQWASELVYNDPKLTDRGRELLEALVTICELYHATRTAVVDSLLATGENDPALIAKIDKFSEVIEHYDHLLMMDAFERLVLERSRRQITD